MNPTQIRDELLHWVDEKMATIRNEIFTLKGTVTNPIPITSIDILARV